MQKNNPESIRFGIIFYETIKIIFLETLPLRYRNSDNMRL